MTAQIDGFTTLDERAYDIPEGGEFRPTGLVGQATKKHVFDCGWNDEEGREIEGKTYPVGRIFSDADAKEAERFAKTHMGAKYPPRMAALVTMPLAGVRNLDDETRAKFARPIIQSSVTIVGFTKAYAEANQVGWPLVTAPSFVDAYAVAQGWYEKTLFSVGLVASNRIETTEDCTDVIEQLFAVRQAIWLALGEENVFAGKYDTIKSPQLREAFTRVIQNPWAGVWCRLHSVFDPSPKAFYAKKSTGEPTRNWVPAVTDFFPNERAAIAVAEKELAERTGRSSPNGTVKLAWVNLSATARETYVTEADWLATLPTLTADLARPGIRAPKKFAELLSAYGIEKADVEKLTA